MKYKRSLETKMSFSFERYKVPISENFLGSKIAVGQDSKYGSYIETMVDCKDLKN